VLLLLLLLLLLRCSLARTSAVSHHSSACDSASDSQRVFTALDLLLP
jgi:hypothetical protein